MRNLYLIRHGTPDFPDNIKLCIGRTDIDIGVQGVQEAERLGDFFRDFNIDGIYSSPLKRCVHTAEIISGGRIEVRKDENLVEIYMGHWEGIPLKDIRKNLGDEPVYGERRSHALARVKAALKRIMENSEGDVICVAHAGVNCAFLASTMGREIKTSRNIRQPCGCYNRFEFDGKFFRAVEIGCIP